MIKHLATTAAALLLSVASASAFTVTLNGSKLNCNTFAITRQADLYSAVHTCSDGSIAGIGAGMAAKTLDLGASVILADSERFDGQYQICYVFQRPFVTGASWEAYYTRDGVTMYPFGHGTYTVRP